MYNNILVIILLVIILIMGIIIGWLYNKTTTKEGMTSVPTQPMTISKPTLVLFWAEWCGHCKNILPTWNDVENTLQPQGINVVKMEHKSIDNDKYNILGFPTIRYYPQGLDSNEYKEYKGDRSLQSIIDFAK